MALPFIFAPEEATKWGALLQGDVLSRTDELTSAIQESHAYYANAEDYHYFMVLTQSCDLVGRKKHPPRARYITIAAVRPFHVLLDRIIENTAQKIDDFPLTGCLQRDQNRLRQVLEKLLHNTEDGYFFIRRGSHPEFEGDYCVFLALSIALRTEDHYETCLRAKAAQLEDVFQAKVGWMTGNLYSRVGTPDLEEHIPNPSAYKKEFYEEALYERALWLTSAEQKKQLQQKCREAQPRSEEEARSIVAALKADIEMVAERVADKLAQKHLRSGTDQNATKQKVINVITSDNVLKQFVR